MPAGGGEARTAGSGDKRSSHAAAGELSSYLPELKLRKDELVPPPIAWPTVALFLTCVVGWTWGLYAGLTGAYSALVTVPVQAACVFAIFTPMHDAAHGSVATNKSGCRWINNVVGRVAALPFMSSYPAFRYIHLQHHKHVNKPEDDPDHWSGSGPLWLLPLKWVTQEWYYYFYYFSTVRSRRTREAAEVLLTLLGWVVGIAYLCRDGHGSEVWWYFVLPGRIAAATLIFTFDYIPHRPHESLDKYEGTNVTSVAGDITAPLTPVLLYQNYHNIHHLIPYLPFYHYSRVWFAHKDKMLALGTKIRPLFPLLVSRSSSHDTAKAKSQ